MATHLFPCNRIGLQDLAHIQSAVITRPIPLRAPPAWRGSAGMGGNSRRIEKDGK